MKVLVLVAHTRRRSLCESLGRAYAEGARGAGAAVRECHLADLRFDPDVHGHTPTEQPLEPDLQRVWNDVLWADHLVVVFPAWWGVGPARLKGLLDRLLLPGSAFEETADGRYSGLLGGRTAHLLTTLDMPPWVYRWIYRAPGLDALRRSTLGLCGVRTTRTVAFGPVHRSPPERRAAWIDRARALGESLRDGSRSRAGRWLDRAAAWLLALRLQFYPMSWMAYTVGALVAARHGAPWDLHAYLAGYACLFLVKAATVFTNERVDLPSDIRNPHAGPFNGGSRVIVAGRLTPSALQAAATGALTLAAAIAIPLVAGGTRPAPAATTLVLLAIFAMGYTARPLRLSWRGWGEVDVALTHSIGAMAWGAAAQGGDPFDPALWALSLPLALAILPSIVLSGLPDRGADATAGKRTLAVRCGSRGATRIAAAAVVAANVALWSLQAHAASLGALAGLWPWVGAHSALLLWLLHRRAPLPDGRIDGLMVASLTLILWFVGAPLLRLH